METGRWIGPWHGVCPLCPLPLLLLSKLVSKLDVLPGQFEVASLPPPLSCQHTGGQVPVWAWGTEGGTGRLAHLHWRAEDPITTTA